jgi:hypothetical protein
VRRIHADTVITSPARVVFVLYAAFVLAACGSANGPGYPDVAVLYNRDSTLIHQNAVSLQNSSRYFYSLHPDQYDFLVFFTAETLNPAEVAGMDVHPAYYVTVRNDVEGIGFPDNYDVGTSYGSTSRLQGVIYLGAIDSHFAADDLTILPSYFYTLAHEVAHRFGIYATYDSAGVHTHRLLDNYRDHWTLQMDNGGSPMGGCDWRDNGDGTFTVMEIWTGLYSWFDLYLMGLASPSEVNPVRMLVLDPKPLHVQIGETYPATTWEADITNIIKAEGQRFPPYGTAPDTWRMAFILVARTTRDVSDVSVERLDQLRTAWPGRFHDLTRGRGTMMTNLGY